MTSKRNTTQDLLDLFCASMLAEGRSERTASWYREQVTRFLRWVQAQNLHTTNWLQQEVIELYLLDSRKAGNTPATVANHYRALRGFFVWLRERGYIEASPMANMKPPKVPKQEPRRAQLGEFERLLQSIAADDWVGARDRLIVNLLFLCGLRLGECADLTADDFRLNEHLLIVRGGKTGARLVPLLQNVERAFVAYMFTRPAWPDQHLFLSSDGGGHPKGQILGNGIRLMLRRRCQAAGLRMLNPHSFRHGLAMHLLNEGGDMSLVQKVLGHSQISTTAKHYAEWLTDGMQREFAEKMGDLGR